MKVDGNLYRAEYSFVCNYCTRIMNRTVIEHNASCKSGLPNTSNTDSQRSELKNRDIGENIQISIYVNLNIKLTINIEMSYMCQSFLLESQ